MVWPEPVIQRGGRTTRYEFRNVDWTGAPGPDFDIPYVPFMCSIQLGWQHKTSFTTAGNHNIVLHGYPFGKKSGVYVVDSVELLINEQMGSLGSPPQDSAFPFIDIKASDVMIAQAYVCYQQRISGAHDDHIFSALRDISIEFTADGGNATAGDGDFVLCVTDHTLKR